MPPLSGNHQLYYIIPKNLSKFNKFISITPPFFMHFPLNSIIIILESCLSPVGVEVFFLHLKESINIYIPLSGR